MKCNFCGAELENGETLCQACGKSTEDVAAVEQTADVCTCEETCTCTCGETSTCTCEESCACACGENCECAGDEETGEEVCENTGEEIAQEEQIPVKPGLKGWKLGVVIAASVVLLGVLVGAILYGMGVSLDRSLFEKSYTVSDTVLKNKGDVVVATIGDRELTNAELQIYYWMVVYENKSNSNIDKKKDLSKQMADDETYQKQFLDDALEIWEFYVTAVKMAEEAGYELSEEEREYLDGLPQQMQDLAQENGQSVQELLDEMICPGTTEEAYLKYSEAYSLGYEYVEHLFDTVTPAMEDLEEYYEENETVFIANKISKDAGICADVRHILLMPEGGTEDETGNVTYTEDEWTQCLKKAEELLEQWKNGEATEESFSELAKEHSEDGGSSSQGGLYTDITPTTNFVPNFLNWTIVENRQVGDTGIVESPYGYHIMYYVGGEPLWIAASRDACASAMVDEMIEDGMEKWPMKVDYKKIALGSTVETAE